MLEAGGSPEHADVLRTGMSRSRGSSVVPENNPVVSRGIIYLGGFQECGGRLVVPQQALREDCRQKAGLRIPFSFAPNVLACRAVLVHSGACTYDNG